MVNLCTAIERIASYLPLSYMNIVKRSLCKGAGSILDVGCGKGQLMEIVNRSKDFFVVGIDLYATYIKECKRRGTHSDYLVSDARFLPFRRKSFDTVLCLQVIEHLSKGDGLRLIQNAEETARKQVIISTPAGLFRQKAYDGNPLQIHKSSWVLTEFKVLGYKVKGQGLPVVYGERGLARTLPRFLAYPTSVLSYAFSPLTYRVPQIAAHFIAVKSLAPRI